MYKITLHFSKCAGHAGIYLPMSLQLSFCVVEPSDIVTRCCSNEGTATCFTNVVMDLYSGMLFRFNTPNTALP